MIAGAALAVFSAGTASSLAWDSGRGEATGRATAPGRSAVHLPVIVATKVSTAPSSSSPSPSPSRAAEEREKQEEKSTRPVRTTAASRPTAPAERPEQAQCVLDYEFVKEWEGGWDVQMFLRYEGSGEFNGWTLSWRFPGNERVVDPWDAEADQNGSSVTFTHAPVNSRLAKDEFVHFGFEGTGGDPHDAPTDVLLNGSHPCAVNAI